MANGGGVDLALKKDLDQHCDLYLKEKGRLYLLHHCCSVVMPMNPFKQIQIGTFEPALGQKDPNHGQNDPSVLCPKNDTAIGSLFWPSIFVSVEIKILTLSG